MLEMIDLLAAPFVVCLILVGIYCYLGLHVVSRGVIFVDISLAQMAVLGATVALLAGYELDSLQAYIYALCFVLMGAGIFALSRMREERVPQEAIIGIVYAVSSAVAVLILDRAPHGHEAIKTMLVGSVLYVTWEDVVRIFSISLGIGILQYFLRKKFILISTNFSEAWRRGWAIRSWDFLFYMSLGIVVVSSVKISGVLLIFSYLVVPAVCAMLFTESIGKRLAMGWILGVIVSFLGIYFSVILDFPTGATIITTLGIILILSGILRSILQKRGAIT